MRPQVFRFFSLVGSFILASSALGFAQVTDGERTNFAADFLERLDVVKGGITFGFGEHAIIRSVETQTTLIRRYTATKLQQQVAEQNARTYIAKLSPEKKQQLKKKKVQYRAGPTISSEKTPPGAKPVMIIDVPRETLASKNVYELSTAPKPGTLATYDDMVALNVGH